MAYRIKAQKPEEFQAWVAHMQTLKKKPTPAPPATAPPAAASRREGSGGPAGSSGVGGRGDERGREAVPREGVRRLPCPQRLRRAQGDGRAQPGQRGCPLLLAAGTLKNTDENLARWIRDPQGIKKGVLMPNLGVTEAEAQALVAYPPGTQVDNHDIRFVWQPGF